MQESWAGPWKDAPRPAWPTAGSSGAAAGPVAAVEAERSLAIAVVAEVAAVASTIVTGAGVVVGRVIVMVVAAASSAVRAVAVATGPKTALSQRR